MSAEDSKSRFVEPDYIEVIRWMVAAPAIIIWMMASTLPIYSLFGLSRTFFTITADIAFLGSGALGLITLYGVAQFAASDYKAREQVVSLVRGKHHLIAGYSVLWITFYTLYRWFLA